MKKINLLLLITIAGTNACGAMAAKSEKIIAAPAQPSTQPILFFNFRSVFADFCDGSTARSVEHDDIHRRLQKADQQMQEEYAFEDELRKEITSKFHNKKITLEQYTQEMKASYERSEKIPVKYDDIRAPLRKALTKVQERIREIAIAIGKRMNAIAVFPTDVALIVDSACDITKEVCDIINKEYREKK